MVIVRGTGGYLAELGWALREAGEPSTADAVIALTQCLKPKV